MSKAPFIVWNDDYSVGHDEIDKHHKEILQIINDLYDALQNKYVESELHSILDRLLEYTKCHFKYEEEVMKYVEYDDLKNHKILHKMMVEKTAQLIGNAKATTHLSKSDAARESLQFLRYWWLDHICVVDNRYKYFIRKAGKDKLDSIDFSCSSDKK